MTHKAVPASELAWDHAVVDIPHAGLSAARAASPDELARIAAALDLAACTALGAEYRIAPVAGGRYQLVGRLRAQLTQTCVVTLEPLDATLEEDFAAVFWPEEDLPAPTSGELALDDEPEREAILAGKVDVGRIVFESLAAALDPFPRKPDAVLDWQPPVAKDGAASKPESPFAVLANLKVKG
jgi:uncharacterized metal-binding protein YceD (DUF177 family)